MSILIRCDKCGKTIPIEETNRWVDVKVDDNHRWHLCRECMSEVKRMVNNEPAPDISDHFNPINKALRWDDK